MSGEAFSPATLVAMREIYNKRVARAKKRGVWTEPPDEKKCPHSAMRFNGLAWRCLDCGKLLRKA